MKQIILISISILIFASSCSTLKSIQGYKQISCVADTVSNEDLKRLDITKYELWKTVDCGNHTDRLITLSGGYARFLRYKKNNFGKSIEYDSLGRITLLTFWIGTTMVGREYYFDELGNVTEIKNLDEGYSICWEQAEYIAKCYSGKLYAGELDKHYGPELICYNVHVEGKIWSYRADDRRKRFCFRVFIDGNTGEIIHKEKCKPITHY